MPQIKVTREAIDAMAADSWAHGHGFADTSVLQADGSYAIQLEPEVQAKLNAVRRVGETYSDCIIRLATPRRGTVPMATALQTTDDGYHALEAQVADLITNNTDVLFTTDADQNALWVAYLREFPPEVRAYYTCHACRDFIQHYGRLALLDDYGQLTPLLWAQRPALGAIVQRAKVTGVYRWGAGAWGTPSNTSKKTGVTWSHLSGLPRLHHGRPTATPDQQMAALREDFGILARALEEFSRATVEEAVRVLTSGALTRSEKAEGVATWLLALYQRIEAGPKKARCNIMWRAIATAPPGFAHVRSSVLGTLLEDIAGGLAFAEVSRRWAEKLHPLQYQRPTAPAREGQIAVAEKRVQQLGIERSLKRRFATLDDVLVKLWQPRAEDAAPAAGGVFGVLREEAKAKPLELPAQAMTWEKFARTVLSEARTLDILVPMHGAFYGLVTAADPEAPPILQWDGLDGQPRNPVSWYFYAHGSLAQNWGLTAGWAPVSATFAAPYAWQAPDKFAHQGRHLFFAIDGSRDSRAHGLALFPEILRADLREIRSVLEAYSNRMNMSGAEAGNANGLAFGERTPVRLRARTSAGAAVYDIDRWD